MLIAFKPNTTNSGIRGMCTAIQAAATASAGSNPAKPSYVDTWRVISNEEAGGWTVENDVGSGQSSLTTGEKMLLEAPSKKTNGTVAKKYFGLWVSSVTTTHYNWWSFIVKFPERTNKVETASHESTNRHLTNQGSTANSTASQQAWYFNYNPSDGEWLISVTENYLYIFRPAGNGADPVDYKSEICGAADLTGTPDNLLGSGHSYDPWVGYFHSFNTNAPGTIADGDNLYDYVHYSHGGAGSRAVISGNSNYKWTETRGQTAISMTTSGSTSTTNQVIPLAPSYQKNSNDDTTYGKTLTASGSKIYSMHPAVIYQPFKGIPYQTIDGLKYLGNYGDAEFTSAMNNISNELNFKYFYDENGDRYIANPSMGIVRLIRAM